MHFGKSRLCKDKKCNDLNCSSTPCFFNNIDWTAAVVCKVWIKRIEKMSSIAIFMGRVTDGGLCFFTSSKLEHSLLPWRLLTACHTALQYGCRSYNHTNCSIILIFFLKRIALRNHVRTIGGLLTEKIKINTGRRLHQSSPGCDILHRSASK